MKIEIEISGMTAKGLMQIHNILCAEHKIAYPPHKKNIENAIHEVFKEIHGVDVHTVGENP